MPIDDDAVLGAIRQGSDSFKVLVATLGGKPAEVQRAVKRLRHRAAIDIEGRSRGARYRIANGSQSAPKQARPAPPPGANPSTAGRRGVPGRDRPPRAHRRAL